MNTLERGESSGMLGRGLGLGALLGDSWGLVNGNGCLIAAVRRSTSYCVGVIFQYSAGPGRGLGLGALLGDSWGLVNGNGCLIAAVRRSTSYCVGVIFQYSAGPGRGLEVVEAGCSGVSFRQREYSRWIRLS